MKDLRKGWTPPQLIVLGRGTPEENVLAGCKTTKLSGRGATRNGCKKGGTCTGGKCSNPKAAS
jgi:hypothetical protein